MESVHANSARGALALHGLTIVSGAFLLFLVQPLVARWVLPWFGGSPAVWTSCMLFFQVALLLGYCLTHVSASRLQPRAQAALQLALLAVAVLLLPITPSESLRPQGTEEPTLRLLLILASSVGLPYLILATTGPLVQSWHARGVGSPAPYRLFALSNAASLLGLAAYPLLLEPLSGRSAQARGWSWAFAAFALVFAASAVRHARRAPAAGAPHGEPVEEGRAPTGWVRLGWVSLAACASTLLLAVTNQACQDVASVPFLWVLPLSLYLLSFILAFDRTAWYRRGLFAGLLPIAIAGVWAALSAGPTADIGLVVSLLMAGLFVTAMTCHGELYLLRPHPRHLTEFYLLVALGGALGGVLVSVVAPLVFESYLELPLGLVACGVLALLAFRRVDGERAPALPRWALPLGSALLALLALLLGLQARWHDDELIEAHRGFHGVLRVVRRWPGDHERERLALVHGGIEHGFQFTAPERRRWATAYYGRTSGMGRVLAALERPAGRRLGCVGLGVGAFATHATAGDRLRFYELHPEVVDLARHRFSYLADTPAEVEVEVGDARLALEREEPQELDFLFLDAFSGDAVPVHLLTLEAFRLYRRHLARDGVIAVHVTNRHLDLAPIVLAAAGGLEPPPRSFVVASPADDALGWHASKQVVLSWDPAVTRALEAAESATVRVEPARRPWTDDRASLLAVLDRGGRARSGP